MEVKNVREQLKFKGPAVNPEKKRLCGVVIKTDQIVAINHKPDEYIDEKNKAKK